MHDQPIEIQYVSRKTYNCILANIQNWVFVRQADKWRKKEKLRRDFEYYEFMEWYITKLKVDGSDITPLIKADGANPYVFENFCNGNDDKAGILRVLNTYAIARD